METTRAIRYERFGGPEVLTHTSIPTPEPGPEQVRVAVRFAGVNPIDAKIRRGMFAREEQPSQPRGTGMDAAGVVDAVGEEVTGLHVGQAVFGQVATGAAATHALAAAHRLVVKPEWLSFEQAAALPVPLTTAVRVLDELAVGAGETLLVHAAAGAVGIVTAQLARAHGATVVGTASPGNHDFLRELGVIPVSYGDGWEERVRSVLSDSGGVDAVLDASGRGVVAGSVTLTGDPHRVVSIADDAAPEYGARFSSSGGPSLAEAVDRCAPLLRDGRVWLPIAATFPLAETADAYARSEAGHVRGKLLIHAG
ncbi:NADP-dependent oxidoreductase [Lipingzhangella sp. LS1_29]|uniref:NADP-dependent oxidoreductase n=1 Tax=Lipingzhangella rawalii TaxID=2055835 RepID=A0ABU2H7Z2_9ACTN|nr:NADP-dependent oxidoreductase [Lipingzhangella rawalii]MDS1271420.1 NADP-dependent oxidoreductase [Lipingzhangella rawalii]